MHRRHFLKLNSVAAFSFLLPSPLSEFLQPTILKEELIGKGTPKLYGDNFSLRKKAQEAFLDMQLDASYENINIYPVSSYRSFSRQKYIWNKKYKNYIGWGMSPQKAIQKIIHYSTIPGTSRHHWGTEIDIMDTAVDAPNKILHPENYHSKGAFVPLKQWMDKNARNYGYHLVYTNDKSRSGFNYEPWHYSFKELSIAYLCAYTELDFNNLFQKESFEGVSELSKSFLQKYFQNYILGVNPRLIP